MVDKIISLLKEKFPKKIQTFDCASSWVDPYEVIFQEGRVEVRWCKDWNYVEVLGLSTDDYAKVYKACGYTFS